MLPCLEDDLKVAEAELLSFFFFLSLLLFSDETSGELLADLLTGADMSEKSLVQEDFETVVDCSPSDSSEESSDPEDSARPLGHATAASSLAVSSVAVSSVAASSVSASFSGVFWT